MTKYTLPKPKISTTAFSRDSSTQAYYTAQQMTEAYQAGQRDMREATAKVCKDQNCVGSINQQWMQARCEQAINALPIETI